MKNKLYILMLLSLLNFACALDQKTIYVHGGYQFKMIDKNSVCFSGWTEAARKKRNGTFYIPEKIYNWNVVEIGRMQALEIADGIKCISVPESVKKIRDHAFINYKDLEEIVLPDSLSIIEDGAFLGCKKLKEILLPKGIKKIGRATFAGCISLTHVIFQDKANWYVKKEGETSWQPIDVSNPSINAENLKKKAYIWEKRP